MDGVLQWITTYGYGAVFVLLMLGVVGLPIPDETLLVFCGYLISKGDMKPLPAWLTAVAGSWCGITLSCTNGLTGSGTGPWWSATTSPASGTSRRSSPAHRISSSRTSWRTPGPGDCC